MHFSQVAHVAIQAFVCLLLMKTLGPRYMELSVFIFAMGYLCICHIYRMYYDYGGYTLDITGPLMVSTQRLTSLAFNVADGRVPDESKLSKNCKSLAVRSSPSLLEFTSYTFSFHMILLGPFCFYKDYIAFVHGTNYTAYSSEKSDGSSNTTPPHPSPLTALMWFGLQCVICGVMSIIVQPYFPQEFMLGEGFYHYGFVRKTLYIIAATSLLRWKYYFGWKLSEAVNASAGLGFNGYDGLGRSKWDMIDNADVYRIEYDNTRGGRFTSFTDLLLFVSKTSSSLKVLLDNWNKMTSLWLRCVVYERVHNILAVFMISAFWHGFYPGYYITFLSGGYFLYMSRLVRRYVRPFFQSSTAMAFFYDALTFTATRIGIAYMVVPFILLEFWSSVHVLSQIYFWMHIAGAVTILVLTVMPPRVPKDDRSKES